MKDSTEGLRYNSVIELVLSVHRPGRSPVLCTRTHRSVHRPGRGPVLRTRTHRSEVRDGIDKGVNVIAHFGKDGAKGIGYNSPGVGRPLSRLLLAQCRLFSYRIRMPSVSEQPNPWAHNNRILPKSSNKQHLILGLQETHPLQLHLIKEHCKCILKSQRKVTTTGSH